MRRSSKIRYVSYDQAGQPGPGLISRILALLVGAVVFGIAVFVGAIFLAGFVGLVLIGSLVFMARVWWLRRQMEQHQQQHGDLDAEYTVIQDDEKR